MEELKQFSKKQIVIALINFVILVMLFILLLNTPLCFFSQNTAGWLGMIVSVIGISLAFITKEESKKLTGWKKISDITSIFAFFAIFIFSLGKVMGN